MTDRNGEQFPLDNPGTSADILRNRFELPLSESEVMAMEVRKVVQEILPEHASPGVLILKYAIEPGKRLVIRGIPKVDKESGDTLDERWVEVYANQHGYLVAAEVVNGQLPTLDEITIEPLSDTEAEITSIETRTRDTSNTKSELPKGDYELISITQIIPNSEANGNYNGTYSTFMMYVFTDKNESPLPYEIGDIGHRISLWFISSVPVQFNQPVEIGFVDES